MAEILGIYCTIVTALESKESSLAWMPMLTMVGDFAATARRVLGEGSTPEAVQEREWEMGTIHLEQVLAEVKLLS
jgi:hypothetical protein